MGVAERPEGYKIKREGKKRVIVMDTSPDDDPINRDWLHQSKLYIPKRRKKKAVNEQFAEAVRQRLVESTRVTGEECQSNIGYNRLKLLCEHSLLLEQAKESWKSVKGYKGLYEISNRGRVKSLLQNGKIMKQWASVYLSIRLTKGNVRTTHRICRLVAQHFVPNPKNYPLVNHKNGKKQDDRASNLEWVNDGQNQLHAYALRNAKSKKAK